MAKKKPDPAPFVKWIAKLAVPFRYPGATATHRQMVAAMRQAERVRAEIRRRLGLTE